MLDKWQRPEEPNALRLPIRGRAGAGGRLFVSALSRLPDAAQSGFGFAADDGQQDAGGVSGVGTIYLVVERPTLP